jgi:1,4-alpha-glucan branching enzyme
MARNARKQRETQVEFVREFPNATQVCLAGTFNEWHPRATEMINMGDSRWAKALMLPPGRYEYRFVVDGRWEDDPTMSETVPNAFGTCNAILNVPAKKP